MSFHQRCQDFYPPDAVDAPIAQQRQWYDALCAAFDAPSPEGLVRVDETMGAVPVRFYTPAQVATRTRILYLHGGGFVVGSLDSHDAICAEIAHAARAELVAVDYRLAPEHVWPAAFEDCLSVLHHLLATGRPLIVAGDSAGGNLAAGLVLRAAYDGHDGIVGQVLIYPGLGGDLSSGSYIEMADAPGLSTADVAYYRAVLAAPSDEIFAFPLTAGDLSGLPPAYLTAAHFDPSRDDARAYAQRLVASGRTVSFREEPQMIHGWLRARHTSDGARQGFAEICKAVRLMAGTL